VDYYFVFHLYVYSAVGIVHIYRSLLKQLIRYCGSYQDFLDIGLLLTRKLLNKGFLLVKLKPSLRQYYGWPLWNIFVTHDNGYVVVNTSRSFPHSRLITVFVNRLTQRVPLVKQELLTLPEHLSSPPVFGGVRVTRSLVVCVCFEDRCLSFWTFSFCHCFVCSSSIYGFLITPLVSSNSSYTVNTFLNHNACLWQIKFKLNIKQMIQS